MTLSKGPHRVLLSLLACFYFCCLSPDLDGTENALWLHLCGHWTLKVALQGEGGVSFASQVVPFVHKKRYTPRCDSPISLERWLVRIPR